MLSKQTEISAKLFAAAKQQFRLGIITNEQYDEILELLLEKLSKAELEFDKKKLIKKSLSIPLVQIDLKETLSIAFAMN